MFSAEIRSNKCNNWRIKRCSRVEWPSWNISHVSFIIWSRRAVHTRSRRIETCIYHFKQWKNTWLAIFDAHIRQFMNYEILISYRFFSRTNRNRTAFSSWLFHALVAVSMVLYGTRLRINCTKCLPTNRSKLLFTTLYRKNNQHYSISIHRCTFQMIKNTWIWKSNLK